MTPVVATYGLVAFLVVLLLGLLYLTLIRLRRSWLLLAFGWAVLAGIAYLAFFSHN